MPALAIPTSLDDLTPAWLTAALQAAGVAESPVATATIEPLGAESGFLCQTVRVCLTYAAGGRQGPASVVAKLPSADPRVRSVIHSFGFYEREAKFYAAFSEANPLRPPGSYFAAYDATTKDTCVLLEDISDDLLDNGEDLTLPPSLALEFAQRLGAFHAQHWGRSPEGLGWLTPFVDHQPDAAGLANRWQRLQERNGHVIPDAFHAQASDFVRHAHTFAQALSEHPRTLVHGDLRVGNVLVARDGLRVVDWQTVAWGRGGLDLGFFLTQVYTPEQRRALEPTVVPAYQQALVDHGVTGYGLDRCWDDYRLGHLRVATMFVQAGSSLDMSGPRSQQLLANSLERAAAAMLDLKPFDLLR